MTPTKALINAVTALCETFGRQATPATVRAYAVGLQGLADSEIEQAVAAALCRCKFMPVPAELRELAQSGGQTFSATAERAFHTLSEACRRHGYDASVNFADGAINAAVRLLGGWQRANELPGEEFAKWYRKEFLATYEGLCRAGRVADELAAYHPGFFELSNRGLDGQTLPNGEVYRLADCRAAAVVTIDAPYRPAIAAPAPPDRRTLPAPDVPRLAAPSADDRPLGEMYAAVRYRKPTTPPEEVERRRLAFESLCERMASKESAAAADREEAEASVISIGIS